MKILFATHTFFPAVGGLETVSLILAEEFVAAGHEVILVAGTPAEGLAADARFPFPVVRRPEVSQLLALMRWCDVYFQNNISLRTLWPMLLVHRPWVPAHHTWLMRLDGSIGWQDRLKKLLLRFGKPIAVSHEVAESLQVPEIVVIGNPYNDTLFRVLPEVPRTRELVLLARLVSDKGGDLLLEAMAELKRGGLTPGLTIIGDGPEAEPLRRQAELLGVAGQVKFTGVLTGEPLVRALNEHRVMVVPSRTPEPFGVVALEGIACGCGLVGSVGGGLQDAIGPCGLTFPNDDCSALADRICQLLQDDVLSESLRNQAPAHLEKHRPARVAEAYLDVFRRALSDS